MLQTSTESPIPGGSEYAQSCKYLKKHFIVFNRPSFLCFVEVNYVGTSYFQHVHFELIRGRMAYIFALVRKSPFIIEVSHCFTQPCPQTNPRIIPEIKMSLFLSTTCVSQLAFCITYFQMLKVSQNAKLVQ
jgi:hypothetical protein